MEIILYIGYLCRKHKPFVGLQDVLKMSSRHALKTSLTRLQCNNFLLSKTSSRRLANRSWRRLEDILQDVLKTSWKTKNCYAEDVLKKSSRHVLKVPWRHVLKTSWRQTECLLGISVSNHGLLTNLNLHLADLYLTNLYFTNLKQIQNELIRTQ